jgi:general secretion pathway protein D
VASVAIALALLAASCAREPQPPAPPAEAAAAATAPAAASAAPPAPSTQSAPPRPADERAAPPRRPFAEIFRGTGDFVAARPQRSALVDASGDFSINFVNADARDVAKAVLGDLLKLNYVVDPGVQGPVTIETSRPVSRDAVLAALEAALRLSGIALVKSPEGLYQLVPAANAARENGLERRQAGADGPGFGVEIVPLRYIGAQEMQHLLEPLVPSGAVQQVDAARNLLVIAGTRQELASMNDDVALFDVDWLSGMSFAFFSPQSVDAKTLAKELGQVIGGSGSPMASLVRLIPIEGQNTVLAISPQPRYLDELAKWAERLDRPGESDERRIYVYRVQHGRAADLAAVLTKLITGSGEAGSAAGAIRPGETAEAVIARPAGAGDAAGAELGAAPALGASALGIPAPAPRAGLAGPGAIPSPVPALDPETAPVEGRGASPREANRPRITADEINNAVLIMATPREYAALTATLRELDVVPLQVLLEAAIAEVTLTKDLQFGVQYFVQKGNNQLTLTNATTPITPSLPGFAYTFASGANISAILSALDTVTRVDVISAPEVMVLNNQTANLQVGAQVPIATQQATSVAAAGAPVVNSIEYRDTGVTLKVTPRVNQGGMVMMDVSQEVSDVASTTSSTLNSPTINQRKISSTIAVHDGETVALGGLIIDNRSKTKNGVPLLQDIPVLGQLFATDQDQVSRTELLVLITPHVVDSDQKAQSVTDELRRKLPLTRPVVEWAK